MRTKNRALWFVLLAMTTTGCSWQGWQGNDQSQLRKQVDDLQRENRRLTADMQQVNADNTDLKGRMEALTTRAQALTDKANELEFVVKMQKDHLATLAEAPKQRDAYQAETHRLAGELAEAKIQLSRLRAQLGLPPETQPAPASQPASQPEGMAEKTPASLPADEASTMPASAPATESAPADAPDAAP